MTVSKLAAETGVSSKTIYGWFAGNRPANLEDIFSVARALGASIEEIAFAGTPKATDEFRELK